MSNFRQQTLRKLKHQLQDAKIELKRRKRDKRRASWTYSRMPYHYLAEVETAQLEVDLAKDLIRRMKRGGH